LLAGLHQLVFRSTHPNRRHSGCYKTLLKERYPTVHLPGAVPIAVPLRQPPPLQPPLLARPLVARQPVAQPLAVQQTELLVVLVVSSLLVSLPN
jgi:hypothetical protein